MKFKQFFFLLFLFPVVANAQVKSTKTNFFIRLKPDKLDSLIYDSTYAPSVKSKEIRISDYISISGGFLVGTSLINRQQTQLIGSHVQFDSYSKHLFSSLYYNRFKYEYEQKLNSDYQFFMAGTGAHFNTEDLLTQIGLKLYGGAGNKVTLSSDFWTGAAATSLYFNRFFKTKYTSFIYTDLHIIYSLTDPIIDGTVSYNFVVGNNILSSFSYKHTEIPYKLSSDSFVFMVGLFLSNETIVDTSQ